MNYQIQEWSYEAIGKQDLRHVSISVVGYWSRDIINVYCHRAFERDWKFSINYGSGGRDQKVEPDDCVAVRNFAEALVAASLIVEDLRKNVDVLEEGYRQYREELKRASEAERAEKLAKLEADPALGAYVANGMVSYLYLYGGTIGMYERAKDKQYKVTCVSNYSGKRYFYIDGIKYPRKDIEKLMADSSRRTDWLAKKEPAAA